ncbi:hypothetical protein [Alpinimonas psychrophila]|uniref:Uncharacterized protein n=1 Tax=Alpinimonas psychrophila TaxID=748908 RepID=A0A7W3JT73_9MICO|nr:hypothetical protein [Alpinimonas psychrophila]MBA8828775.1 hypothetical protein [Alpinimonas psychrophila]
MFGGALPMVETRSKFAQLMRQGISNAVRSTIARVVYALGLNLVVITIRIQPSLPHIYPSNLLACFEVSTNLWGISLTNVVCVFLGVSASSAAKQRPEVSNLPSLCRPFTEVNS